MNKQISLVTPDENQIEELLTKIQPVPSEAFHQKMKQATWRIEGGQRARVKHFRLKMAFAIITLAVLTAFFVTPQGRAWAQEVVRFFTRINSTTILLSEEDKKRMNTPVEQFGLPLSRILTPTLSPEMAGLPECQSSQGAQSYACQIAYAESKLGFDLKEFPIQPEGWEVNFLYFDPIAKTALTGYKLDFSYQSYGQFILIQSLGDKLDRFFNMPGAIVPTDKVKSVKVGSYNGEYVSGAFQRSENDSELIWDDSQLLQRLAWSDGVRWYLIEFMPNRDVANSINFIRRDQLVKLAADLVDKPIKNVDVINPEVIYSISDAEKLSGLDLKAPTLLPLGVDFSSARYLSFNDTVYLHYGMNDELVIYEWQGKSINLDVLSNPSNNDYEIVEVNGQKAFYGFSEGSKPYGPYWFLWWRTGKLNYQMYYYHFYGEGGVLNKEKMIAIAESMRDINDFRGNTFRPYEYVAVYEQALGFNAKEFPAAPAGWTFTDVSAYPHPDCIAIDYTAKKESGELLLKQCHADLDKYFEQYDIPRKAIERVNIGKLKGQYILGNSEVNESGKTVWNPNLPFRRLVWQEGEFWLQITLSGDSIVLYDKDDLISYAESLR